MFSEIALGMLDYRESEEAFHKLFEIEMFDPSTFLPKAQIANVTSQNQLRNRLSTAKPLNIVIAYYLGSVDESLAIQRAKDYSNTIDALGNPISASLLELGLIKSIYPQEVRRNSGEISVEYSRNGFHLGEIAVLTTVVPPDSPVRDRVYLANMLRDKYSFN